jgi:transcriptional regulator with XRE-family HTH domain
MPLRELLNELGIDEAALERASKEYPYARVAEAILELRHRHGLTQAALAALVRTSQPAIARAESGRSAVETSLLNRIAEAVGERWRPEFEDDGAGAIAAPAMQDGDDDAGLAAFNAANTAEDFDEAARIARVFAGEPPTPRRLLAMALAAFNAHDYATALEAVKAARASGLPRPSELSADHVWASTLLALGRPRQALKILEPYRSLLVRSPSMAVAYVQALTDAGRTAAARREADRLRDAGIRDPNLEYHAARAALDQRYPWEALARIVRYRAAEPDDLSGMLTHASALGYLGDLEGAGGAHEEAYRVLKRAIRSKRCPAWRLYGVAAARTGRWRETLRAARAIRSRHPASISPNRRDIERLVHEAIVAATAEGPDAALAAAELAAKLNPGKRLRMVDRARARALASQADVDGVREVLGLAGTVTPVTAADRVLVARALVEADRATEALPLLRPAVVELRTPDDLLFVAEAATDTGDMELAEAALKGLAKLEGQLAQAAHVAIAILEATGPKAQLQASWLAAQSGGRGAGSSASVWRELNPPAEARPIRIPDDRAA